MEDDLKDLAETIASRINSSPRESSLTVKWAVVFMILVGLFAFLFGGFVTNRYDIGRIQEIDKAQSERMDRMEISISRFEATQAEMRTLVGEIRFDQQRRQLKER
jgi:hypothetical protein